MKYYKIVNPSGHHGVVYHEGYNEDPLPFNPSGNCKKGGIYFAREHIFLFLGYGSDVYEVEPIGEVYENPSWTKKYKAHAVNLKYVGKWSDVETIKVLVEDGAGNLDEALKCAASYGHLNVVKYLVEQGAFVEQGADDFNGVLWCAETYGHTDIVKYLKEKIKEV